ncbi:MAG: hypothetical protein M1827_004558 [Pycnora praestabilis]|nr:MAG: hypothetical protein M1827_004558 [Pycnora praestabilis]
MVSLVALAVMLLPILYSINYYRCFARNLAAAKRSGIPYVIVPVYVFRRFWLITHRLWMPFIQKLPRSWTKSWIDFIVPEWSWTHLYEPFERIGSDIFITVAPGANMVWVADPSAISQITTRRNDFPKPIHMYSSISIFGDNVVSTEGAIWRHHRKITSPPFTEKNNALVWTESLHQAQSMLKGWVGNGEAKSVDTIAKDTMRLSLHVISRAGFGVRLLWPGVETPGEDKAEESVGDKGHKMTYTEALGTFLHKLLWVMLMPRWLLKNSPFKTHKIAYQSYIEWGQYMNELYVAKKAEILRGEEKEGMDILGALVNGAGITSDSKDANSSAGSPATTKKQLLSDEEILGNAFVFILAGHETTANSIHFSMLFLALHRHSQVRLQEDLDSIFDSKPISEWDYERDLPKLFAGMVGAVLNEELRLVPPVINIPKSTLAGQPQPLTFNGRQVVIPSGTLINLDAVAVHRNPKYWPSISVDGSNDLKEFKPERWFIGAKSSSNGAPPPKTVNGALTENSYANNTDSEGEDSNLGVSAGADTASSMYHPVRGAYIPFSEGYRACLGRRFAQVEVLAVLAVIFREYTVELAVDEFASDEEVAKMSIGGEERGAVWDKAASRARRLMTKGMGSIITLQMREGQVPLRFVKRGEERFPVEEIKIRE